MRVRIALAAVAASVSLGLVAVPAAEASNGNAAPQASSIPALDKVNVVGFAHNGTQQFTGSFAIQRFVVHNQKVYALGTLTGRAKGRHITRYNTMIPATLTGDPSTGPNASARTAQTSCSILHLQLAPINLNLLGLQVTLGGGTLANQPIVLDITAIPGAGNLLGNLLCGLTNALNNTSTLSALSGELSQLSTTLNSLVGLLGGIASGL